MPRDCFLDEPTGMVVERISLMTVDPVTGKAVEVGTLPPETWAYAQAAREKLDRTFQEIAWELATKTFLCAGSCSERVFCFCCRRYCPDERYLHDEDCLVTKARFCVAAMLWGPVP